MGCSDAQRQANAATNSEAPLTDGFCVRSITNKGDLTAGYAVWGLPTLYRIEQGDALRHVEIIRQGEVAQRFEAASYFGEWRQEAL